MRVEWCKISDVCCVMLFAVALAGVVYGCLFFAVWYEVMFVCCLLHVYDCLLLAVVVCCWWLMAMLFVAVCPSSWFFVVCCLQVVVCYCWVCLVCVLCCLCCLVS